MPVPVPPHLPEKLTITLWDFSWYTRTANGDAFADLDAAFIEAVERGYNTVRICAMPFLLFGSGLATTRLPFTSLGGDYGQRTRWYNVVGDAEIDGRAHLVRLFEAARRHGCYVIVSSWEYQQSPAFLADSAWSDALLAVPTERRALALADAYAEMVTFLVDRGLDDRIAFIEIHNEVQAGYLADDLEAGTDPVLALQGRLEEAVDRLHERAPGRMVTVNYARVPVGSMRGVARNVDVGVFHPYVYGVLEELYDTFRLRRMDLPFPEELARAELLRSDAPDPEAWRPPAPASWRQVATIVPSREVYMHDWSDPEKFDRWLYSRFANYQPHMRAVMEQWLLAASDWALANDVPLVFGEGWVGYTPLLSDFEGGPIGAQVCRDAVKRAGELGAWGAVVCSNAAPHHPMWADVPLQQEINAEFMESVR
jgi:hypothetical protein